MQHARVAMEFGISGMKQLIALIPAAANAFNGAKHPIVTCVFILVGTIIIIGAKMLFAAPFLAADAELRAARTQMELRQQQQHHAIELQLLKMSLVQPNLTTQATFGNTSFVITQTTAHSVPATAAALDGCAPPAGEALQKLGLGERSALTVDEAALVLEHINKELRDKFGASFQGAAADPASVAGEADRDGDTKVSRFELLLALPRLVRPAHWHNDLVHQIVKL